MKRIVILLFTIILPVVMLAQEKVEKRLELKNGNVLTGFVQVQQDGSYLLETASGDIFFFSPAEISKVTDLNPTTKNESAMTVPISGTIFRDGGELRFSSNGMALTQENFSDYQGWEKYQKAKKLRKTGNAIMLWGPIGCVAAGIITGSVLFGFNYYSTDYLWGPIAIGGMVASAPLTACIIIKSVGNKRLNRIAEAYNQRPGYVLNFGAQQYGVGFALNF